MTVRCYPTTDRSVRGRRWGGCPEGAIHRDAGTEQLSIRLDVSVIAFFKAKAGKQSYETLINQALHRAMDDEHMEDTLRRVVREELASHRDDRRD